MMNVTKNVCLFLPRYLVNGRGNVQADERHRKGISSVTGKGNICMMNDVVRSISLTTKEMYDERHSICLTADEIICTLNGKVHAGVI